MDWFNWLLAVVALIVIWRMIAGGKNGFAEELEKMITLIVIFCIGAMALAAIFGFVNKRILIIVLAIVVILLLCAVHKLLMLPLDVFKRGTKLKAFKAIDVILGILIGAAEGIIVVWFAIAIVYGIGALGSNPVTDATQNAVDTSVVLTKLQDYNYIQKGIDALLRATGK